MVADAIVAQCLVAYHLVFIRPVIIVENTHFLIVLFAIIFYEKVIAGQPEVWAQVSTLAAWVVMLDGVFVLNEIRDTMLYQPSADGGLALALFKLHSTDGAGAVDGAQVVVGCLTEPIVVDAATNPHKAVVVHIVLMGTAVVIASFAIFLDALGYPFVAALQRCLLVGIVGALGASAALADVYVIALLL